MSFISAFHFQDFKVLTLLGKGSFACVYRAKSVNTGLEVAIKMVRLSPLLFLSECFLLEQMGGYMLYVLCAIVLCARVLPQIDKKAMHKAGMVQRVINEVEIQCRLKHPSILEVSYSSPSGTR